MHDFMGKTDKSRCVFPLTSLQIGDLQSYLSHLSIFLAPESKKIYILVDNQPWLNQLASGPTHFWQLMVTKSRLSPFANTRGRKERKGSDTSDVTPNLKTGESEEMKRWFSLLDAATLSRNRALLPVKKLKNSLLSNSKLNSTLYGFIVFEIAWNNVRGLNYLNELQTDTYLAIEAKVMERWEFDSIKQAVECLSSWFQGTLNDQLILKEYLDSKTGMGFSDVISSPESETDTFSPGGPSDNTGSPISSQRSYDSEGEDIVPSQYKDVLILFRFEDCELPFKLKDIIMSNLRLLTLLEAGLPSWVLFLQSYPVFCHIYRPWMCPLARILYVLISIVTVLIGFYDLYKNVPLLKATASRLFGPLFDWVESWEMVTRIRYLGTMLFLHNFKKELQWFIMTTRTVRSCLRIMIEPMLGPFVEFLEVISPLRSACMEVGETLISAIWTVITVSCNLVGNFLEIILLPVWYLLSFMGNTVMSILYPIFWILYAPIRLAFGTSSLATYVFTTLWNSVVYTRQSMNSVFQLSSQVSQVGSTVNSYEVSMWRSLWNDLFSQVFKAISAILNGFVAFFTACNRHRLSIYNHVLEFGRRLSIYRKGTQLSDSRLGKHTSEALLKEERQEEKSPSTMSKKIIRLRIQAALTSGYIMYTNPNYEQPSLTFQVFTN